MYRTFCARPMTDALFKKYSFNLFKKPTEDGCHFKLNYITVISVSILMYPVS